jgi:hypothetical protein
MASSDHRPITPASPAATSWWASMDRHLREWGASEEAKPTLHRGTACSVDWQTTYAPQRSTSATGAAGRVCARPARRAAPVGGQVPEPHGALVVAAGHAAAVVLHAPDGALVPRQVLAARAARKVPHPARGGEVGRGAAWREERGRVTGTPAGSWGCGAAALGPRLLRQACLMLQSRCR